MNDLKTKWLQRRKRWYRSVIEMTIVGCLEMLLGLTEPWINIFAIICFAAAALFQFTAINADKSFLN